MKLCYKIKLMAALGLLITILGCLRSDPARFYILTSIVRAETDQTAKDRISLGVGPVTIPDYLDRPQIVTRAGLNEIRLAEFDKWAGSFKEAVSQTIAQNLSAMLNTDKIFVFPWREKPEYQAAVDIIRLDAGPGSNVTLEARWSLWEKEGTKMLMIKTSHITMPMNGNSYETIVSSESRALEELSREIANHILKLRTGN